MIKRISRLLGLCDSKSRVMPPTDLYNEGWMLKVVLDWFSQQAIDKHPLSFAEHSRWYSEILLPSPFLPRSRKDPLAEAYTHADGAIGHFTVGRSGKGDINLNADARQLVIIEAKMFSRLSRGIKNFKDYDQATRTTACIAKELSIAQVPVEEISVLGFYVIAPEKQLELEPTFNSYLRKESMTDKVKQRVEAYGSDRETNQKNEWYQEWFLPTIQKIDIRALSWEEIIEYIISNDSDSGISQKKFYDNCLKYNQHPLKTKYNREYSGQTGTGKLTEASVLNRLSSLGLDAYKPIPDKGIDIIAKLPDKPDKIIKIQVKGRNPKKDPNWRWFQIRVSPNELLKAKNKGIDAKQAWIDKVNKVDFFVLYAVKHDEMWVLPKEKVFELIKLNENRYGNRPDNVFAYDEPLKQKQKEMNLDIEVEGEKMTERFSEYKNNFQIILDSFN
jgi:hypothetical protein